MDRTSDRRAARASMLARLKTRIDAIERGGAAGPAGLGRGAAGVRLWPGVFAPAGVLHEVRCADYRDAPAALGFSIGLARLIAGATGAVAFIERAHEAARSGALSARGLAAFGFDPARALFIRTRTEERALWAAEETARSKDVAATVLLVSGKAPRTTLVATRRLNLAALASGATPILVRTLHDAADPPPSAAAMRWRVAARPGAAAPFDARAPGPPRFLVTVEKAARGASAFLFDQSFLAEWRHDEQRFVLPDRAGDQAAAHSGAGLSASFGRSLSAANEAGGIGAARAS